MMNDTVARIVEIKFQDVEMNEETTAIRDEVMDNCQERYNDLVNSGVAEDDAIAAVIESLKGMEEVLAPYKTKAQHVRDDDEATVEMLNEKHVNFASHEVDAIDLQLVSENVHMEPSEDGQFHILWNAQETPMVQAKLECGVIRIDRMPDDGRFGLHSEDLHMEDFIRAEKKKIEINMESLEDMIRSIGSKVKGMLRSGHIDVDFSLGEGRVTIQVPPRVRPHVKMLTTSGDISVRNVELGGLHATSTSGDLSIDLKREERHMVPLTLHTTSGDIEAAFAADSAQITSTSGDVEVEGQVGEMNISTISGDIDVRAEVKKLSFKAISGDADLRFEGTVHAVHGSTISGDIMITLPPEVGMMAIETSTRSGDVTTRCHTDGKSPGVTGSVSSMSGDIVIR